MLDELCSLNTQRFPEPLSIQNQGRQGARWVSFRHKAFRVRGVWLDYTKGSIPSLPYLVYTYLFASLKKKKKKKKKKKIGEI
jgi:hypothetical protein